MYGGGFYYSNTYSNQANQCQINSNSALFGGGIFIENGLNNGVQQCNFISNSSPTIVASNADYSYLVNCNILTSGISISNDGTSDSNSITNNYYGTINLNNILSKMVNMTSNYIEPFRLSRVGITQANIIPPGLPVVSVSTKTNIWDYIILNWTNDGPTTGYKIYKSPSNDFINISSPYDITFTNIYTDKSCYNGYYYVTSFDNATPYSNESFFNVPILSSTLPCLSRGVGMVLINTNSVGTSNRLMRIIFLR
jgi:hypothetical protein